jgi:hypothetical protein
MSPKLEVLIPYLRKKRFVVNKKVKKGKTGDKSGDTRSGRAAPQKILIWAEQSVGVRVI